MLNRRGHTGAPSQCTILSVWISPQANPNTSQTLNSVQVCLLHAAYPDHSRSDSSVSPLTSSSLEVPSVAYGCTGMLFAFLLHKGFWSYEFLSKYHGSFFCVPSLRDSWPSASSQPPSSAPQAPAMALQVVRHLCSCPSTPVHLARGLSSTGNPDDLNLTQLVPIPRGSNGFALPSARFPSPLWAHANQVNRALVTCSVPVFPGRYQPREGSDRG